MKDNNLVSVIVPAYNCREYIEECIESILKQTHKDIELMIIDDGSTDGTADMLRKLADSDDRIVILSQSHRGVVAARRKGLENAKGRFLSFVDADDWIVENMIEILFDSIGDCDLVSAGVVWEESRERRIKRRDLFCPGIYDKEKLPEIFRTMIYNSETGMSQDFSPWMCNKLFRRDMALKVYGSLDESLTVYEDAAFTYLYLLNCESVMLLDEYPYHYRFDQASASHRKRDSILEETGRVYTFLSERLGTFSEYGLKEQLQQWILEKSYFAINERMETPKGSRVIRYLVDARGLYDKKIVLYGAGRAGRDVQIQLLHLGIDVVLWVDKRYLSCQEEGLEVSSPEEIGTAEYDLILIAAEDEKALSSIRRDLGQMGVSDEILINAHLTRLF